MAARGNFSNRLGFIAAVAGSAVGLGNIWQFPYKTGQGGGAAFLFIYLIWIFLIGLPLLLGEVAIGRKTQANPYGAYKMLGGKNWALVGLFGIICGVMILSFYNVVAGWAFGYFTQVSFGNILETPREELGNTFNSYIANWQEIALYGFVFMVLTAVIVMRGVQGGIEKASKILMPALFVILIGLIVYGLTLDNAMAGVSFYLVPDFSKVTGKTVYTALGQAFFSLSLGMGALITYGSYIKKGDNIVTSATLVTIADTAVAFLAGFMIFPLVFSLNIDPTQGDGGPGLVFVALTGVFQSMGPVVGKVVGGSFFLLLCFAALTSTISLLEVPVAFLVDEKKWKRSKAVIVMSTLIFIVGIPSLLGNGAVEFFSEFVYYDGKWQAFMTLIIDVFNELGLPGGGFVLSVFIAFVWKTKNMSEEISDGFPNYIGSWQEKFFNIMITIFCPLVLGLMFIFTLLQKFFGVQIFV